MGGACSMHGVKMRYSYNNLVGKSEENRLLGRSRHRWEDSITMGGKV
jgi:hypothetical protein